MTLILVSKDLDATEVIILLKLFIGSETFLIPENMQDRQNYLPASGFCFIVFRLIVSIETINNFT